LKEACICNLGEAYRKKGKTKTAIKLFVEAEKLAQIRSDLEAELSVAQNRALALADAGDTPGASQVLSRCRDASQKALLWDLYVRALHGLANLAWLSSDANALGEYRRALREARRYKLDDHIFAITINLANALSAKRKPKQAFELLKSVSGAQLTTTDNHCYYSLLGATAAETGHKTEGIAALRQAILSAEAVNNSDAAASASAHLARLLEEEGNRVAADKLLSNALTKNLNNARRLAILHQRLELQLKEGNDNRAEATFREIQKIADAEGLAAELVDTYMLIGDHEWKRDKSRANALKAYIAAMLGATSLGIDVVFEIGTHITTKLLSLKENERASKIARLLTTLKRWLVTQNGAGNRQKIERLCLWPIRIALRIAQNPNGSSELEAKTFAKLVEEEFGGNARSKE
jgi:tetratricopeptide (TPR) repeat protein